MLAILHGSQTAGTANSHSDWDVGVLEDHALSWDERVALQGNFAARLNVPPDKIDISDLRSDSPLLRYRVAMGGKLIAGDPYEFRKFQILAWKDYLNNEKMFDLRSKFLAKALS
jgi:predicted nucleotidyltransferase